MGLNQIFSGQDQEPDSTTSHSLAQQQEYQTLEIAEYCQGLQFFTKWLDKEIWSNLNLKAWYFQHKCPFLFDDKSVIGHFVKIVSHFGCTRKNVICSSA